MSAIERKQITPRMSRIVIHNDTVYLCGQVGAEGKDIKEQAEIMLGKVDTFLEEAGSDRNHMLSITVYLSDMGYFKEFNEVYDAWVPAEAPPARACVEARLARPGLFCEVSVIAAVKK